MNKAGITNTLEHLVDGEQHSSGLPGEKNKFSSLIPLLHDYIQNPRKSGYGGKIDHAIYNPEFLNLSQHSFFPEFSAMDRRPRDGFRWDIEEDDYQFVVRPIQTIDELADFIDGQSDFCFFNKNHAQLYLYAAHAFARLLGIWQPRDGKMQPIGVVPMLLMRMKERLPLLYVEAPMIMPPLENSMRCKHSPEQIFTDREQEVIINSLLDILPVYAAIQYGYFDSEKKRGDPPYYVIGDCRKVDSSYGPFLKRFVDITSKRLHPKNKIKEVQYYPEQGNEKKLRKIIEVQHDGTDYLELPQDEKLNNYLQKKGYGHLQALMFTQAFLLDEHWQQSRVQKEWGKMEGDSRFVADPLFHAFYMAYLKRKEAGKK